MPCLVGIDFGNRRIGVAISDSEKRIAFSLDVLQREEGAYCLKKLKKLLVDREIDAFVVGLPLMENGDLGEKGEEVLQYVESLSGYFQLEVFTWDERYTTLIAENTLLEDGVRRKGRKSVIDKLAAQIILQSYLDHINHTKPETDKGSY